MNDPSQPSQRPPSDPTESPILNTPYEPPIWHWNLDADFRACQTALLSRRPSGAYLPVPKPRRRQSSLPLGEWHRSVSGDRAASAHKRDTRSRPVMARLRGTRERRAPRWRCLTFGTIPIRMGSSRPSASGMPVETAIYLAEGRDEGRDAFVAQLDALNKEAQRRAPADVNEAGHGDRQDDGHGHADALASKERILPRLRSFRAELDDPGSFGRVAGAGVRSTATCGLVVIRRGSG